MALAILGGSFDPPHLGHVWVARQILDYRLDIEKVLLVPANQHQWKPIIASAEDRLTMLDAIADTNIAISRVEIDRGGVSYTADTLQQLKKETNTKLYWIVGSDILSELDKWENAEDMTELGTFLVFPRDPHLIPEILPKGFEAIREPHLITSNISSTAIRRRIHEGMSISEFVPEKIISFIEGKSLYK